MKKRRGKPAFEMIIARGRGLVNGVDKSLAGAWDGGEFLWILFYGAKTPGKGKPREKGAEIEKERDDTMQICNISSRAFLCMLKFLLDYEILQKAYKFLLTEFIDAKTKHVAKMEQPLLDILH